MSKYENLNKVLDIICIIALVLSCVIIVLIPNDNTPFRNRMTERLKNFSYGWRMEDGKEVALTDVGKLAKVDEYGENRIVLYNTIPTNMGRDYYLNFRSKNVRMRVFIQDRLVYEFQPKGNDWISRGTGHSFHTALFKEKEKGKQVKLDIIPDYRDGSSAIRFIYIGNPSDFQGMMIDKKVKGFILCIFTIIVGILLVVTSLATKKQRKYGHRMRILGILAICVGSWSLFETLLLQLLFGYSTQIHDLIYVLLILMPYYLVSYVNESIELKWKYSERIAFLIIVAEVTIMATQKAIYGRDFHETLEVLHLSMLLNVALAMWMILRNLTYCWKNKIQNAKNAAPIAVGLFMVLSSVDIIRYQFDKGVNDAGTFMRMGIFVAILILSVDLMRNIIIEIKNTEHMETMAKLAYTDTLTGMPNRAAFEKKEKELEMKIKKGELKRVWVYQLDLNFLKKVNDNYGHAYGDRHIKACAKIINEVFGNDGFAFRVGGDEFTVFAMKDSSHDRFQEKVRQMKELEDNYNKTSEISVPLHIALGYSIYTKSDFESIKDAEIEADKKMYEFKEAMKKKGDLLNDFEGKN